MAPTQPSSLQLLLLMLLPFTFLQLSSALPMLENAQKESYDSSYRALNMRAYSKDPETVMSVPEIIRYHGYRADQHLVQTEDGYLLTVQRIPYGKSGPSGGKRTPVLVLHGLLCSSAIWVINTPDKNLAYRLADAGYDVWLGNFRGNNYGERHINMSKDQQEFWEFSFDEMAKYDLPATIDYILKKTGFSQLHYVGHSMGTVVPFAMLSSKPEYNAKIRSFMALAPVATLTHMTSVLKLLKPIAHDIAEVMNYFKQYQFLKNDDLIKFFSSTVCLWPIDLLCSNLYFLIGGVDKGQTNITRIPVYTHHVPSGTSLPNIIHFAQMVGTEDFPYYDYGTEGNIKKYGQATPPYYDVTKITAPVALFWSDGDVFADPTDVAKLAPKLPNLVLKYRVPLSEFSHLDFMWALDVNPLLYNKVLETLSKL